MWYVYATIAALVVLAGFLLTPHKPAPAALPAEVPAPPQKTLGGVQPTYFAQLDSNNIVTRVIVADQAFIDSGKAGDPKNWVQTWVDGSSKTRYAGVGYTYDKVLDAFVAPKPGPTYTFNPTTKDWDAPPKVAPVATTTP